MHEWNFVATCPHCNTTYAANTQEMADEKVFRCSTGFSGLIDKTEG